MFQLGVQPQPGNYNMQGTDAYTIGTTFWSQTCNGCYSQAYHAASINMAMADGSVRKIPVNITPSVWYSGTSPNDGGLVSLP
jgi:prepilin-type processing-associated H-X9-DG protein